MKLSQVKKALETVSDVNFKLENGTAVPSHFHVTEIGMILKHFIDCGGTVREEKRISFQLWNANDTDHRLVPGKLIDIISLSEKVLGLEDLPVEVEYQSNTIGKYDLEFNGTDFLLVTKQTACLASDHCGIPAEKQKKNLAELQTPAKSCCAPESGCCN